MKSQINGANFRKSVKPKYKSIVGLGGFDFSQLGGLGGMPGMGGGNRFDKVQSFKEVKSNRLVDCKPGVRDTFTGPTSGECINLRSKNGIRLLMIDNSVDYTPPMDFMAMLQGRQQQQHKPLPKNLQVNITYKFQDMGFEDKDSVAKLAFELFRLIHGKRSTPELDKSFGMKDDQNSCLFDFIKTTNPFYFEIQGNVASINFSFPEIKDASAEKNETKDQIYLIINKFKDSIEHMNELVLPDINYYKGFYENIANMRAISLDQFQEPAILDQTFFTHIFTPEELDSFLDKKENIEKVHSDYTNHSQNINIVINGSTKDLDEDRLVEILESKSDKDMECKDEELLHTEAKFIPPTFKNLNLDLGKLDEKNGRHHMDTVSVNIKIPFISEVNVVKYFAEMLQIKGENSLVHKLESEYDANLQVTHRVSEDRSSIYIMINAILTQSADENKIFEIQELILKGIRGLQLNDIDVPRLTKLILGSIKSDTKLEVDTQTHYIKDVCRDLYNYNAAYAMFNQDETGLVNKADEYCSVIKNTLNNITYDNIFFSSAAFQVDDKPSKIVYKKDAQGLKYNVDDLTTEQNKKFKEIMDVNSLYVLENNYNINIKRENKYLKSFEEPPHFISPNDPQLLQETVDAPTEAESSSGGAKVNVYFRGSLPTSKQQGPLGKGNLATAVLQIKSAALTKIYNYQGAGELGRMFFREVASNCLFRASPEFEFYREAQFQIVPLPNLMDNSISVWIVANRQHLRDVCKNVTKAILSPINTKLFTHKALMENVKAVNERRSKPIPQDHFENIRAISRLAFDDVYSVKDSSSNQTDIMNELFRLWNEEVVKAQVQEVNVALHMDYRKEQMSELGKAIAEVLPSGLDEKGEKIDLLKDGHVTSQYDSYDTDSPYNKLRNEDREYNGTCVLETLNGAIPNPYDEIVAVIEKTDPSKSDIYNSCIFDGFIKSIIPQKEDQQNQMAMMMGQPPKPPKNIYGLKMENRLVQLGRNNGKLTNTLLLPFSAADIAYLEPTQENEAELNKKITCDNLVVNFERCIIEDLLRPVLESEDLEDPKVLKLNEAFQNSKDEFAKSLIDPDNALQMYIEDVYAVQSQEYNLYDNVLEYVYKLSLHDFCKWLKRQIQNIFIVKVHSLIPKPVVDDSTKPITPKLNNYLNSNVKVHNDVGNMKVFLNRFLDYMGENKDPELVSRLEAMKKETEITFRDAEKIFANTSNLRDAGELSYAEVDELHKNAQLKAQQDKVKEGDKSHGVDTTDLVNQTLEAMKKDPDAFKLDGPKDTPKN